MSQKPCHLELRSHFSKETTLIPQWLAVQLAHLPHDALYQLYYKLSLGVCGMEGTMILWGREFDH